MSEDVKLEVIRNTQDSLSKYIKKPPLTEKLLRKPPFKYLHDITTAIMRETGFLKGLYSQDELNPENIKDRDAKIAFLEKLIAAVNYSTGANITARPNKIVAGLDVVKTNELLQTIAKALEKKVDSTKAVEQVLNVKSKGVSTKKENSKSKLSKDTRKVEGKTSRDAKGNEISKKKSTDKAKNVEKKESSKRKTKDEPTKAKSTIPNLHVSPEKPIEDNTFSHEEKTNSITTLETLGESTTTETISVKNGDTLNPKSDLSVPVSLEPLSNHDSLIDSKEEVQPEGERTDIQDPISGQTEEDKDGKLVSKKEDNLKPEENMRRPRSARSSHKKHVARNQNSEVNNLKTHRKNEEMQEVPVFPESSSALNTKQPQSESNTAKESIQPRSISRPASSRPGAPRVRDRGTVLLTDNDNKADSDKQINLIVDSKGQLKDDDESLVTVEASVTEVAVDKMVEETQPQSHDQGHLVSQILETQKELEDVTTSGGTLEGAQKVDISWSSSRQREQEAVPKEAEKLRLAIQSLTKAANPLGKLIDFLQEDVDSMQTELETWIATNQQLSKQMEDEERLTEERIQPLLIQLENLDQLIEEQLEEIIMVKGMIIQNDERLTKLLRTNSTYNPG